MLGLSIRQRNNSRFASALGAKTKNATLGEHRGLRLNLVAGAGFEPNQPVPDVNAKPSQDADKAEQNLTLASAVEQAPEQKSALPAHSSGSSERPDNAIFMPEDLAQVVDAWDRLPPAVKAGIVAMVAASKGE